MKGGDDELKLIAYILLLHSTPKRLCPDVSICNLVTPGTACSKAGILNVFVFC